MITALVLAQALAAAEPVAAAEITAPGQTQAGVFGGFRLVIPLDGEPRHRQVRGALALAPMLHSHDSDGKLSVRLGEGIEYGFRSGRKLSFSIGGHDLGLSRLGAAQDDEKEDGGVPTWVLVAGGVVIAVGVGGALFYDAMKDASE